MAIEPAGCISAVAAGVPAVGLAAGRGWAVAGRVRLPRLDGLVSGRAAHRKRSWQGDGRRSAAGGPRRLARDSAYRAPQCARPHMGASGGAGCRLAARSIPGVAVAGRRRRGLPRRPVCNVRPAAARSAQCRRFALCRLDHQARSIPRGAAPGRHALGRRPVRRGTSRRRPLAARRERARWPGQPRRVAGASGTRARRVLRRLRTTGRAKLYAPLQRRAVPAAGTHRPRPARALHRGAGYDR